MSDTQFEEEAGLDAKDIRMLSRFAYDQVKGQLPLLYLRKEIRNGEVGISVNFFLGDGDINMKIEFFSISDSPPRILPSYQYYPKPVLGSRQYLQTVVKVRYSFSRHEKEFSFFASFDNGIFDGTTCSCLPYSSEFTSWASCMKHKIYPTDLQVKQSGNQCNMARLT